MRLEDLKNDFPKTPDFIHTMIVNEVAGQIAAEDNSSAAASGDASSAASAGEHRFLKGLKRPSRVAAAALAGVLILSTTAYAGNSIYRMYKMQTGPFSVSTGISSSGAISLPDEINEITITADYVPKGMVLASDRSLSYSYSTTPNTGGISVSSVLMDSDDMRAVMHTTNVVESEETDYGRFSGVYIRTNDLLLDGSFHQTIYLLCPDYYRILIIYGGDDVSKKDLTAFTENLSITAENETFATEGYLTWSDYSAATVDGISANASVGDDDLLIRNIGETFEIDNLSVSVDNVQVADDLSLLDPADIPKEWADALNEDGSLKDNHVLYVASGDGINSIDSVTAEADIAQKLVFVTATYTNTSGSDLDHILYLGNLLLLDHKNSEYRIYRSGCSSESPYDNAIFGGEAAGGSMVYSSVSDSYGDGGNYIPSLKNGESIIIHMAWIINEDDLDHMYLNLNPDGGEYEFTDSMLTNGLVDIRQ